MAKRSKVQAGTCAYCGEAVYVGERAHVLVLNSGFVHPKCWDAYVKLVIPNQLVTVEEVEKNARDVETAQ